MADWHAGLTLNRHLTDEGLAGNHDSPAQWTALKPLLNLANVSVFAKLSTGVVKIIETRLFYQAIPPIYLKNRFEQADGSATRRLHSMASRLDVEQTSFHGWKLAIAEASRSVTP